MPYVQASPRVRTGYAAALFSTFAFLVAAGLSLETSPFCTRAACKPAEPADAARISRPSCAPRIFDPTLAGVYDTTWGVIALDADGTARGSHDRANDTAYDVVGRWHMTHDVDAVGSGDAVGSVVGSMIHFEWATGSYSAAREWWRPR